MTYQKLKLLAEGGFSNVYLYYNGRDSYFAGKWINKTLFKHWKKECEVLEKVGKDHENIVHYYPIEEHYDNFAVLYMELCQGDLEKFVLNNKISEPAAADGFLSTPARDYFDISAHDVCHQVVKGLRYLHSNYRIVHRDVKPTNVLMLKTTELKTLVKIADFGLSRDLPENSSFHHSLSTSSVAFMAPECYEHRWYLASDVYSLGILLYYVFTDGCIMGNFGEGDGFLKLRKKTEEKNCKYSKEQLITLIDLIKRMVKKDPHHRFSIDNVFHHPTFWDSKRKIEFYKKIKTHLASNKSKEIRDSINLYNAELLDDSRSGFERFQISKESISVLTKTFPKNKQNKCSNVQDLLRLIRNVEAHITDPINSDEYRSVLGVCGENVNWDQALSVLTGGFPQLLVHLYELFRTENVAVTYYHTNLDLVRVSREPSPSPIRSSDSLDENLASVAAGLDPELDWMRYYKSHYRGNSSIYDFELILKYIGTMDHSRILKIKQQEIKVFYPSDASDASNSLKNEFHFPDDKLNDNKILPHCKEGIVLSTDSTGDSLYATRKCQVKVFFSSHSQKSFLKLEQDKRTKLFSHDLLQCQLQKPKDSSPSPFVKIVFGKDPDIHEGLPVVLLIKPVIAGSVIEQLNPSRSDDVLLSLEHSLVKEIQ